MLASDITSLETKTDTFKLKGVTSYIIPIVHAVTLLLTVLKKNKK